MNSGRRGIQAYDAEELAEEQGWVARMVHLFRSDDLEVQFQVGGESLNAVSAHPLH